MNDITHVLVDWQGPTRHFYHVCPACLRPTGEMEMLEKNHTPTQLELEKAGYGIFELIGHEVLGCPCGRELTWFDMMCMERVA